MRDILERLQGPRTPQGGSWPYPNLHDEAADEITRLREENARLREALNGWQKWWALPWQDRRPDMADVCWKKSRIAIREGGKDA